MYPVSLETRLLYDSFEFLRATIIGWAPSPVFLWATVAVITQIATTPGIFPLHRIRDTVQSRRADEYELMGQTRHHLLKVSIHPPTYQLLKEISSLSSHSRLPGLVPFVSGPDYHLGLRVGTDKWFHPQTTCPFELLFDTMLSPKSLLVLVAMLMATATALPARTERAVNPTTGKAYLKVYAADGKIHCYPVSGPKAIRCP